MRVLSLAILACLPSAAFAQINDFKIYPSGITGACTSFVSRCSLGGNAGELLEEYPMQSTDFNGGPTDFFRGIGQTGVGQCEITNIKFGSQDQNCADQEAYSLVVRPLAPTGSGPDPAIDLTGGGINLLTPLAGAGAHGFSVDVALTTPLTVPCQQSWFVGISMQANPDWSSNGQSLSGAWYSAGFPGEVAETDAADFSWQIDSSGIVGQCGSARTWNMGVSVSCPTLQLGNLHTTGRCTVKPSYGIGGMYPSNSARMDGLALQVKDKHPNASLAIVFISASASPIEIPLPGIIDCAPILIGPAPFLQVCFSVPLLNGRAECRPGFLGLGRLVGFAAGDPAGADLWFQAATDASRGPGLVSFSNAAAVDLSPQ